MTRTLATGPVRWNGRRAVALANDAVELVLLAGGGHVASFRLRGRENVFWQAEWKTIEPSQFRPARHARLYGAPPVGDFLCHFTGHTVCADYFGAPSAEEVALGYPLHGEIASQPWKITAKDTRGVVRAACKARAPRAQFRLEREVSLRPGEYVAYFREKIVNERAQDRCLQWVQHATFGKPLLAAGESAVALSGSEAVTWPNGYEGKALLPDCRPFRWPHAPALDGALVDLAQPFSCPKKGFVVSVLVERERRHGFVAALNWRLGIVAGYCFRRADFPWIAVWEENRARSYAPWNGRSQARGLEFGTSPTPSGLRQTILDGPMLGEGTLAVVPAKAAKEAVYVAFVARIEGGWRTVRDVEVGSDRLVIQGDAPGQRIPLSASGLEEFGF